MSTRLKKGQFTTIGPDEIWKIYNNLHGIFRGGGNSKSPKLVRADGPRRKDLDVRIDPDSGLEMVYPNPIKGLSFADSVDTLARKSLEGHVWLLPKGSKIPKNLVFNIKDKDHPLLNVSKPMSVLELTALLTELADLMVACDVKIDRSGRIIEGYPGALLKVENA
ncbi:hypothetical protein [Hahella sp. HN01]|uniref:Tse2 family ADP-ribosyltransferase toxin n=1 Tax=Hahella sp. HN01 TaxID=2847262 RepID=UPI001C1E9D4B|nr:hypothetical protein [Hahella sp. HN01]MBU6953660.1 hypothetical protein [Hahella sp. HN01]